MDTVLEMTQDLHFQENMDTDSLSIISFCTEIFIHLPNTTTADVQEVTLMMANGTTAPDLATSHLNHGNNFLSFMSEVYNYTTVESQEVTLVVANETP